MFDPHYRYWVRLVVDPGDKSDSMPSVTEIVLNNGPNSLLRMSCFESNPCVISPYVYSAIPRTVCIPLGVPLSNTIFCALPAHLVFILYNGVLSPTRFHIHVLGIQNTVCVSLVAATLVKQPHNSVSVTGIFEFCYLSTLLHAHNELFSSPISFSLRTML